LIIMMLGFLALGVDIGYLAVVKSEMKRAADAAALAGAADLKDDALPGQLVDLSNETLSARQHAVSYVAANRICNTAAEVDPNLQNAGSGDVVVGYLPNDTQTTSNLNLQLQNQFNAVQVTIHKNEDSNGEVPLFFARIFGLSSRPMIVTSTAALWNNFSGFQTPSDGSNLELLPFALDVDTWNGLMAGGGSDSWSWNGSTVQSGADGVREVNLYPQGTGSPGNRGTVDIGSSNNSTADIARQIVYGISPADLAHLGGKVELDPGTGTLQLNGDTGISAGVKDELASIRGQPRIIPIFSQVQGPGNNAQYTIVKFAAVRIMEVVLTGKMSSKRVIIQPCSLTVRGGIPSSGPQNTHAIYSPVRLVR
jgi:hypothetical protein